ncbi:TetR/AcrR family transcriptional regulator [Novosphingobium colocasiae]|uniref:TetR/AcrR family transcriptional regulator n=1 Tax=Novosphingobium colocasiae TaxID=1256513 RepID=UPI0035ADD98A
MIRSIPKAERRGIILDRVEELINATSSTDFTMQTLAGHVGVSPTTFYNIFGSKGAVLYDLLNRGLDEIMSGCDAMPSQGDPVRDAVATMTFAAEFFVRKSRLYRPLYKFQLGERDMAARPSYLTRGLELWRRRLAGMMDLGYLHDDPARPGFTRHDMALALLSHSSGVIDLWVQGDLDDDAFVARMTHDAWMLVLSVVPDARRAALAEEIHGLRARLGHFGFVTPT